MRGGLEQQQQQQEQTGVRWDVRGQEQYGGMVEQSEDLRVYLQNFGEVTFYFCVQSVESIHLVLFVVGRSRSTFAACRVCTQC